MPSALIMALGQTFVIISGGTDLSVGFVMGMASVASAPVMCRMEDNVPLFTVVLVGLIIARLRVLSLIVTLGM